MNDNVAALRDTLLTYPDMIPAAAEGAVYGVRNGTCTCCPGIGEITQLDCGHCLCRSCIAADPARVACALAS